MKRVGCGKEKLEGTHQSRIAKKAQNGPRNQLVKTQQSSATVRCTS